MGEIPDDCELSIYLFGHQQGVWVSESTTSRSRRRVQQVGEIAEKALTTLRGDKVRESKRRYGFRDEAVRHRPHLRKTLPPKW